MKPLKPFEISYSGINLVEASAGTGKTYNITSLYIRALIELDVSVDDLLVVTYTEAATKELKDRLLKRIRESINVLKEGEVSDDSDQFLSELITHVSNPEEALEKLQRAVRCFDEAAVYTIHGFCYQSLQEQAFESRAMYNAEMIGDDSELVQEAVDDYWRNWIAEFSEDKEKKVLLDLITGQGYNPDKLAKELGSYIGKPYLHILPNQTDSKLIEKKLSELIDVYGKLKVVWSEDKQELWDLLDTGNLSYYTTNKLNKWFRLMDEFLHHDMPSLETFTQFYRFEQANINDSLNKKAREANVQPPQHDFFGLTEDFTEALEIVRDYEIVFKKELLLSLRETLKQKKEVQQVLSYDDLLLQLRDALLQSERGKDLAAKLRRKYPIALVDEFQDTDPNQYEIFRAIYKGHDTESALFMIGDPKQSIYSFRGADIFSYIEARNDAPEEYMFNLQKNFRSTPRLLEGLNLIWGSHDNPFVLDDISFVEAIPGQEQDEYDSLVEYGEVQPPVRFNFLTAKEGSSNKGDLASAAAENTASEIKRLIAHGKSEKVTLGDSSLLAKDIAVLVRTHKQASLIKEALQKEGIKSVQYSQESVFQSEEAYQLEVFLKAVAEPANESRIKTALSLPLTSFKAGDLLNIEDDEQRWLEILTLFSKWNKQWQEHGFAAMFRSVLQKAKISEHVIKLPNGERALTNILHIGELLQQEATENGTSQHGLIKWLARKRQDSSRTSDEEQLRLESDEELVKIVTMHRSKGLEYPVVFCPFLWYGPRYSDSGQPLVYHNEGGNAILDLNGKNDGDRAEKRFQASIEELAESVRLAYVAMTRARNCLYIPWGYADNSEFSALGYLFQDPEQTIESLKKKLGDGKYEAPDGSQIESEIRDFCADHSNLCTTGLEVKGESPQLPFGDNGVKKSAAKTFKRMSVDPQTVISSFSSLISSKDDVEAHDYDQFTFHSESREITYSSKSIFTFPRGPQPGTCIHRIYEEIDFGDPTDLTEVVNESLSMYGISTDWEKVVSNHVQSTLKKKLAAGSSNFSLSDIGKNKRIPELEFYFKNGGAELSELLSIIRDETPASFGFEGATASGFLKGFIDLTFEYDGKFYLLDYKTNHLGDSLQDYDKESMQDEIYHHMYDLQYHIYSVALHRFLKLKISNYSYDTHFGGAFYLFLRGINEQGNEGIFFDRPEASVINDLDTYFDGGKSNG